jgi:gliding motility-associated-like protein
MIRQWLLLLKGVRQIRKQTKLNNIYHMNMKNLILTLLMVLTTSLSFTQFCPYLGNDQLLSCGINSTTLTADLSQCGVGGINPNQTTNYSVTSIPFINQTNTGTLLSMSDDSQQGPFNIGFNFCFFGQTYTQFYVGSNGWISFSPAQPTTFTSATIPSVGATIPKNCIMGPWQDWHPGLGGQIRYQVQGTAPCRKLVVSWVNVPMFSCTNLQGTFHIVIYETTNIIENHIVSKPNCLSWAGGTAVEGVHNNAGTIGITVPGRNSTAWTANNDSWRWTPSGPVVTPTLTWYQVGNPAPIGTGQSITVTPPAGGANYTCRFVYPICNAGWAVCNVSSGFGPDTVFVLPGQPNIQTSITSFTEPLCYLGCDGTATVTPINGTPNFTYLWSNGQTTQTAINLCVGVYDVLVTDDNGCTGNSSITINQPTQVIFDNIIESNVTCDENDGSIIMVGNGGTQPYNYFIDNVSSNDTINGLSGGNYLISIQDVNGCQIDSNVYLTYPTPITPSISPIDTVQCIPGNFTFINTSSPSINMVSTFVMFGDNTDTTTLLTDNITHTYDSVGVWDITMSVTSDYGCVYTQVFDDLVETRPLPTAQFNISPNPTTFFETSVMMQDQSYSNIVSWYWYSPDGSPMVSTYDSPTITFPEGVTGQYPVYLTVIDNLGCSDTTSRILTVESDVLSFIPNTFTPDGNEYNQGWGFNFAGIDEYRFNLYVFNRWGEMIWECHNPNETWDGTYNGFPVQQGMYSWKADFGVVNTDERRSINGFVNVIR